MRLVCDSEREAMKEREEKTSSRKFPIDVQTNSGKLATPLEIFCKIYNVNNEDEERIRESCSTESIAHDVNELEIANLTKKYTPPEPAVPKQINDPLDMRNITQKDIDVIYDKWKNIKNDLATFSNLFVQELNEISPECLKKFEMKPGTIVNGKIVYCPSTLKEALKFIKYISNILRNLNCPKKVYSVIYEISGPYGYIKPTLNNQDEKMLTNATMNVIIKYYKTDNTPELLESFKKVLTIIYGLIADLTLWDHFGDR